MEKKVSTTTLKKYVFDNLYCNNDGIPLKELSLASSEITDKFTEFKELLVKCGFIEKFERVEKVKIINRDGIDYLIIQKGRGEYIVIDVNNNCLLSNKDKHLFDSAFFIKAFNESINTSFNLYNFDCKGGSIKPVYEYAVRNQRYLDLEKAYIYFSLEDELAKTLFFYNFITGETVIHFKTSDNMDNQQLYLFRNFECLDNVPDEILKQVPNLRIPIKEIPEFLFENGKIKKIN